MAAGAPDRTLLREFGGRVRALRRAEGLSQQGLAERAGVNWKYVGAIERGERNPSLDVIARLARGLGTTLDQLFYFGADRAVPADRVAERRLRYGISRAQGSDKILLEEVVSRLLAWIEERDRRRRR